MRKTKYFSAGSLVVVLPLFVIFFFVLLSVVNGITGYKAFRSLFEEEYRSVSAQYAYTALTYVDGDKILSYSSPASADDAWTETDDHLYMLTLTASLSRIQVVVPNKYFSSRRYIYDSVHPQVIDGKKHSLGSTELYDDVDAANKEKLKEVMTEGSPYVRFDYSRHGGAVTTSLPVKNSHGEAIAILSVTKSMNELMGFNRRYLHYSLLVSGIVTVLVTVLFIVVLLFYLVKPLALITNETSSFVQNQADLTGELSRIRGHGELPTLARSIEKMSEDMRGYVRDLTRTTAEKERLSTELDVATQIQSNMLPRIFPPFAMHPEIGLFASMEPAKEVGGDFYDFFMIDDDQFAFVVGDVSGKGVPAALFMVIAKTLIKNVSMHCNIPSEIFRTVNNYLCEGNEAGYFVTCWIGIIRLSTGELTYCNAGHPKPLFAHGNEVKFLDGKIDLMLAAMEGMRFTDNHITLERGDRLLVYTDGVTEATDSNNVLYGEERLLDFCKTLQNMNSREVVDAVRGDIVKFAGDAPQFDDITLLEFTLKNV